MSCSGAQDGTRGEKADTNLTPKLEPDEPNRKEENVLFNDA